MLGNSELRYSRLMRAETLDHCVDLLLEVGAEVLVDVVDEEVDVPREGVVGVECALDAVSLDVVADGHGELVDEGRGHGGGLDEHRPVETDLLLHGDGELDGHVEVAQESCEEGRGGDEGLVGDEGARDLCGAFEPGLGGVVPILHVLLVHPREDLLVEGVVVQGVADVKVCVDLARCLVRVLLLVVELERGSGGQAQCEYEGECTAHEGWGKILYSKRPELPRFVRSRV